MVPTPAPALTPYTSPGPAPHLKPERALSPAPGPAPPVRGPFPDPTPAPTPLSQPSESEEEETETKFSSQHEESDDCVEPSQSPSPIPLAPRVSNPRTTISKDFVRNKNCTEIQRKEETVPQEEEEEVVIEPATNGYKQQNRSLKAAAELIYTLDTAYAEANAASATTALDADEARTVARTAAEIIRRYANGSHPREGSDLTNNFDRDSSASAFRFAKSLTTSNSARLFPPAASVNSREKSKVQTSFSCSIYFPKASPSNRLVNSRVENALALTLALERAKQALETERMAHDETKNLLATERSKNSLLQQKLKQLESSMETQRESLGRSGDALEEELQRAIMRMEAAEEDAQSALDFAKDSEEARERLERMLDESLAEMQSFRHQRTAAIFSKEEYFRSVHRQPSNESPMKSSLKHLHGEEGGTEGRRSVQFSDPIVCYPPIGDSFIDKRVMLEEDQQQQHECVTSSVLVFGTPCDVSRRNRPSRPMVSAGRKLLQESMGKGETKSKTFFWEYTPDKSVERRQRLSDTLKEMNSAVVIPNPPSMDRRCQLRQLHFSTNVLQLSTSVAQLLLASASRLALDGHWWRDKRGEGSEELQLDLMARQYCQSVEVKISRQKGEIAELESLCSFLEESVAS